MLTIFCRLHEIKVMLHPYTADNDDERFVCMQLVIKLDKKVFHNFQIICLTAHYYKDHYSAI